MAIELAVEGISFKYLGVVLNIVNLYRFVARFWQVVAISSRAQSDEFVGDGFSCAFMDEKIEAAADAQKRTRNCHAQ